MGTVQTLKPTNPLKSSTPSVCYLNSYKDNNFSLFHNKIILLLNFCSCQCHLLPKWVWCINISLKNKSIWSTNSVETVSDLKLSNRECTFCNKKSKRSN